MRRYMVSIERDLRRLLCEDLQGCLIGIGKCIVGPRNFCALFIAEGCTGSGRLGVDYKAVGSLDKVLVTLENKLEDC